MAQQLKKETSFVYNGQKYIVDMDKFNAERDWLKKQEPIALAHDPLEGLRHLIKDQNAE